ncbi:MAG TPA: gliding motility-associated C-terminal domain-containing protein, partial [Chitinophagales bacterium]|nr:gliding motility-associated C-terminal domain-containing protein [Chitinophagales bacterium]
FGASDGAIDVTVTNAVPTVTYAWFTGQNTQDISGIPQGSYTVTVTDGNNCTAIGSFVVNEPAALVLTQPTIVQVLCFGGNTGSITVNNTGGTGPFSYTWNPVGPNAVTYSGLTAGNYDVTITDDNGCTDNATYQVTQPASALAFAPAVIVDVACSGAPTGSITVSVSGGTTTSPYSYSWSHNAGLNNPVASGLTAGQYTVTVTDANGCTLTQTNTVNEPTPVTFGPPTIVNVTCAGGNDGSVAYNPTGGTGAYTYTWNGVAGTNPQTGLAANSYTVVITDASGCTFSATVTVSEPAPLVIAPVATDATCNGAPNGSIDANISGGTTPYQPVWSNGETTEQIFGLLAGLYTITVTDGNGCTASSGANVNEPLQLSFFLNAEQVKCPGDQNGSIEIVNTTGGTPPYNYAATMDGANFFYPGNIPTKIEGLASGNYAVILSDGNGCTLVDTAFVPAPIGDTYSYTTDSTSCYGKEYTDGGIHVTGFTLQNMPYQFSVDGGLLQYSGDFYGLAAGPHTVLAQNYFGCDTSFTVVIPEPVDAFAEALPGDTTIGLGESIQLSSAFGPYPTSTIVSYSWSPTLGLSCIDCANPIATPYARETEYLLTITYNDHCIATAGMTVVVDGGEPVFIPNSFSPNGDGNNDVFQIYGVGIKTIELKIFNRWGEKVYESNNQFEGWDGTYKGTIQQPAVFVYHVTVTYLNDKKMQKVGSITLIK